MARRAEFWMTEAALGGRTRRLDGLYRIRDAEGRDVPFFMNGAQRRLFEERHHLNVILKARQLGFTTFIQLLMLDACLFNANTMAGTIAHTQRDATLIFRDKVRFAYDRLPEKIRKRVPATEHSTYALAFANGSVLRVGTSLRSGTYQFLHVSEYGKICARFPDKAEEIRTGGLNTVHAGQTIFIESTAEGQGGDFHDLCQAARQKAERGEPLTALDFRFHFFPWWQEPGYAIDPDGVPVPGEIERYFARLAAEHDIELTPAQRAWYALKAATQGEQMRREFPSTPDEAFAAALDGAYYAAEMARADRDGRITRVPYEPAVPVNTFWDLGRNDDTVIWFHQRVGREHRFIDYYRNSGEGLGHYAQVLRSRGYAYGTHYLPHDVEIAELSTNRSRRDFLEGLGVRPMRTVPRVADLRDGIQLVRGVLPACWFDTEKCAQGIADLRSYRRAWNVKLARWRDTPQHDAASHGADAFRTFAEGWREETPTAWPARTGMDYDPLSPAGATYPFP